MCVWTFAGVHLSVWMTQRQPRDRMSTPPHLQRGFTQKGTDYPLTLAKSGNSGQAVNCLRVSPNRQRRSTEPNNVRQKWRGNSRWVISMTQRSRFFLPAKPKLTSPIAGVHVYRREGAGVGLPDNPTTRKDFETIKVRQTWGNDH